MFICFDKYSTFWGRMKVFLGGILIATWLGFHMELFSPDCTDSSFFLWNWRSKTDFPG